MPRVPPAPIPHVPPGGGVPHIHPHIPVHASGKSDQHRDNDDAAGWIILAILGVLVLVPGGWLASRAIRGRLWPASRKQTSPGPNDWRSTAMPSMQDLILQPGEVGPKAVQTHRLMEFLVHQDRALDPSVLHQWIALTFLLVQKAGAARDYSSVRHLLLPGILARHEALLKSMRDHHEFNRIEGLQIERLEFVHLHCPHSVEAQEVTALITFRASVYFVDDRTEAYTRGLRSPTWFQEFWIFRRRGTGWLLQDIEQSHESDRLERSNLVEDLTAQQLMNAQTCIAL
jgi:hypothetical protein